MKKDVKRLESSIDGVLIKDLKPHSEYLLEGFEIALKLTEIGEKYGNAFVIDKRKLNEEEKAILTRSSELVVLLEVTAGLEDIK